MAAAAAASPSRIAPPSSQTMNASSPSSESGSGSSSPNHSNRFSRASTASRNGDSPSPGLLRSEEYRQLFRLPAEEVLVQDFNCALQENILLQGHMYLFDHYLCFYSNIFGFETKKIIPFQDITSVRRAKTAGIFPNAIEITAAGKKHFFASFLSRDEAFKLIADGWSQNGNVAKELLDRQDSKSEISSQLNGVCSPDSPASDYDSDERNLEVSGSRDTELSQDRVSDDGRGTDPEASDVVEEKQNAVLVAEPSTSSQCRDAPEIPKSYTKVGESKFPINTEQFFDLFFSDDGFSFVESYHKACGDKDFSCTSWTPHDKFGHIREISFQHPIKIYFGAKCGGCKETQKYEFYKNSHLVIRTSQEVSDVPYADYFTVEGLWDVQKDVDNPDDCILRVYVTVAFSKRTIWKGKIETSTMEECRETYGTWIQLAHELLKQKNIEKTEATGDMVEGYKVDGLMNGQNGECADGVCGNADSGMITSPVANTQGNHEETRDLLQGTALHATAIFSTVIAFAVRFYSSLKSRGNVKVFLVIALSAIFLLMQLSIVVLLSRPQQVYVIPQADHITYGGLGSGHRAAETVAWMEKRVHLLNDEMLVVEAQLERMRHEHILLKTQLKDLERLTKQQR